MLTVCLLCGVLAGCGVAKPDYDKVVSENEELKNSLKTVQATLAQEQDTNSRLQEEKFKSQESSAPADSTSTPVKKEYEFTAGKYIVNKDIPAGMYDIVWVSGNGNCFAEDVIESFGNRDGYLKTYKNATVPSGSEIEVSSDLKVKFVSK